MNSFPQISLCVLTTAMLAACSDGHEGSAHDAHAPHHAATQDSVAKPESDTIDIKTESDKASKITQTTRSADAHTHGDATLAIVLENKMVTIELDTPVYNILGFEHAPQTDLQKTTLEKAQTHLKRGDTLFALNNQAKCTSLSNDVTTAIFDTQMLDGEKHDSHGDHQDHTQAHDKGAHSDEGHADPHDEGTHTDIVLTYEFKCKNPEKFSNVRVNLFKLFENLSEINAIYLGPSTQSQVTLTPIQPLLDVTR